MFAPEIWTNKDQHHIFSSVTTPGPRNFILSCMLFMVRHAHALSSKTGLYIVRELTVFRKQLAILMEKQVEQTMPWRLSACRILHVKKLGSLGSAVSRVAILRSCQSHNNHTLLSAPQGHTRQLQLYAWVSEHELVVRLWWSSTSWLREVSLLVLGEELRRRLLLNLLLRSLLIWQAWSNCWPTAWQIKEAN